MSESFRYPRTEPFEFTPEQWDELHELLDGNITILEAIVDRVKNDNGTADDVLVLENAYIAAKESLSRHPILSPDNIQAIAFGCSHHNGKNVTSSAKLISSLIEMCWEMSGDEFSPHSVRSVVSTIMNCFPFEENNDTIAWVIQTWMTRSWDNPQPLITDNN